jgi:hypothetical protein
VSGLNIAYFSIAVSIFLCFTFLHVLAYHELRHGYIESKPSWFLLCYTGVFFLKAVIYSVRLFPKEDQIQLMNFLLIFFLSCGSDLITFLLYTFVLEMREVIMTIGSMDQQEYLLRSIFHRRLKISMFSTFLALRLFL